MIELFCHKATAAPSVVEIDIQPQVYQINAQLVVRNCSPHISKIYSKEISIWGRIWHSLIFPDLTCENWQNNVWLSIYLQLEKNGMESLWHCGCDTPISSEPIFVKYMFTRGISICCAERCAKSESQGLLAVSLVVNFRFFCSSTLKNWPQGMKSDSIDRRNSG